MTRVHFFDHADSTTKHHRPQHSHMELKAYEVCDPSCCWAAAAAYTSCKGPHCWGRAHQTALSNQSSHGADRDSFCAERKCFWRPLHLLILTARQGFHGREHMDAVQMACILVFRGVLPGTQKHHM